ncbi:hypothetical protein M3Y94_00863500 [Aphelenchoides besseyi]|nr:hypothetical protein M3Y94_00858600 [Aphelenchoides besseyi]KAI6206064.1 hypothetical protein M3Y94_00863500 [Aphelenchoides besseyi]KAI6226725.1 hypothetical protein M3Y95_00651100 [Aphelenchoides besseyi]
MAVDLSLKVLLVKLIRKLEKTNRPLPAPVPHLSDDSAARKICNELQGQTYEEREMIKIRVLNEIRPQNAELMEEEKIEKDQELFELLELKNHFLTMRPQPVVIDGVHFSVVVD